MNKLLIPATASILVALTGFAVPAEENVTRASIVQPLSVPSPPVVTAGMVSVSFEREYVTSIKKKEEPKKAEPKKAEEVTAQLPSATSDVVNVILASDNSRLPEEAQGQKLTGPKESEIQTLGRTTAEHNQGKDITNIAKNYLGTKYVWGGVSPTAGWDCSGYVQFVFREAGIELPRVEQWVGQQKIKREEALPGDFIVQDGGSHVGIYAGNGMMYSALNPSQGTMLHPVDILPAEFYRISQ